MATKTIGATARDYSTLAAWQSYLSALGSLAADEIGQCFNDASPALTVSATVTFGGWTPNSHTVTLTCGSGQSFRDNANKLTNALRYNDSNGVGVTTNAAYGDAISINSSDFIIDGLQFKATNANSNYTITTADDARVTIQNCIIQGIARGTPFTLLKLWDDTGGNASLCQNNLILLTVANNSYGVRMVAGYTVTDCTVVSSNGGTGEGLHQDYTPRTIVKNTAVAGFTTDYTGTAGSGSTNNATDKGSFGGTGFGTSGQVSLVAMTEWVSVTNGSEDLRLNSTSAKLKNNGATTGPSTDIVGTSRPQGASYDIGCWELISGPTAGEMAAATVQQPSNQNRRPLVIGY